MLSFSENTAPIRTIIKRIVEIFLAKGSKVIEKLVNNFLQIIPNKTGIVTIINIFIAISVIDIDAEREVPNNRFNDIKIIRGIVMTQSKLIIAVNDTDSATSPFANEVMMFEVAPPGAAAISITPTANSGDSGQINTRMRATIGNIIICEIAPIKKSLGCFITLVKSEVDKARPRENIIKARATGKNRSEIIPISYISIRF